MKQKNFARQMALIFFLLLPAVAFSQIQGTPFTSMIGKDFHPSGVSRGGAMGTFIDDPTSIHYNPAIGPFLEKSIKASVSMAHALLPGEVWLDYIGLFFKPKTTYHVFLSVIYFASDTEMINTRNDKFGEMNSQTFLFNFNLGYRIPKSPISWGVTMKVLTGRSFIYDRTLFGLDGGLMADFSRANIKAFLCFRNLGIDALDVAKLIDNAGPVERRSPDISNAFSVKWPLVFGAGFQYQFLKIFQVYFDLDFYPGDLSDAYFLPHAGVSFVFLPDFKFNVGWVFRDEAGANFPSFGIEWNIRITGLPGFGLQYAFEPIPGFTENHYFGLTMRF